MPHHTLASAEGTNALTQDICNILRNHHSIQIATSQNIFDTIFAIQNNHDIQSIIEHLANLRAELPREDQILECVINSWIQQNSENTPRI